ncbi:uncharacterized protein LOC143852355 [Tasmannia lanceolata]|uniref:uncharacterized protein LOC143852355 n=1 Tax=Tasmannia lanceolata TaxID=3420 RepID=UPI004062AF86
MERRPAIVQELEAPPSGMIKKNFDGSGMRNHSPAGIGRVCRDSYGSVLWGYSGSIGNYDANEAEARAAYMGIKRLDKDALDKAIVEGDSRKVDKWLSGVSIPPWRFAPYFDEIYDITLGLYRHVRRSANSEADRLAKDGVGKLGVEWFDFLSP